LNFSELLIHLPNPSIVNRLSRSNSGIELEASRSPDLSELAEDIATLMELLFCCYKGMPFCRSAAILRHQRRDVGPISLAATRLPCAGNPMGKLTGI